MNAPIRIQRKRTKGWEMPWDAIYVGRPSRWGNPFRDDADPARAVAAFRLYAESYKKGPATFQWAASVYVTREELPIEVNLQGLDRPILLVQMPDTMIIRSIDVFLRGKNLVVSQFETDARAVRI